MSRDTLKFLSATNPDRAATLSVRDVETERYPEGVFVVTCWSLDTLAAKIATVDRKLAKHGRTPVEPISFEHKVFRKVDFHVNEDGKTVQTPRGGLPYVQALVYIEAARIQLSDRKRIVGVIDRVGDSDDVVISPWKDASDDAAAIHTLTAAVGREIRCDHCNSNRRRKSAWILRNEDGSYFEVAKSCGKSYFGLNVASLLNDLIDLDEVGETHCSRGFDRVAHIALTIGVILKHGFVSQTSSYKINEARRAAGLGAVTPTTAFVGTYLSNKQSFDRGAKSEDYDLKTAQEATVLIDENLDRATDLIDSVASADVVDSFQCNVQAAIRSIAYAKDWYKFEALVVAGIADFLKSEGVTIPNVWAFKEIEDLKKVEAANVLAFSHGFYGAIGDKIQASCVVEDLKPLNNEFGGYILVLRA